MLLRSLESSASFMSNDRTKFVGLPTVEGGRANAMVAERRALDERAEKTELLIVPLMLARVIMRVGYTP